MKTNLLIRRLEIHYLESEYLKFKLKEIKLHTPNKSFVHTQIKILLAFEF